MSIKDIEKQIDCFMETNENISEDSILSFVEKIEKDLNDSDIDLFSHTHAAGLDNSSEIEFKLKNHVNEAHNPNISLTKKLSMLAQKYSKVEKKYKPLATPVVVPVVVKPKKSNNIVVSVSSEESNIDRKFANEEKTITSISKFFKNY